MTYSSETDTAPLWSPGHAVADWTESESLELALVSALTEATGVHPMEFVLHESVDVDALTELFRPTSDGVPRTDGDVSFRVDELDCTILVKSDGEIQVWTC